MREPCNKNKAFSNFFIDSFWIGAKQPKRSQYIYSCTVPEGKTAQLTLSDGREKILTAERYCFKGSLLLQ